MSRVVSVVAVVLAMLLAAAGCSADDDSDAFVRDMRTDPVAGWSPAGAQLVGDSSAGAREGSDSRKPQKAVVVRVLAVERSRRAQALAEGRAFAVQHGWSPDPTFGEGNYTRTGIRSTVYLLSILNSATADDQLVLTMTAVGA